MLMARSVLSTGWLTTELSERLDNMADVLRLCVINFKTDNGKYPMPHEIQR